MSKFEEVLPALREGKKIRVIDSSIEKDWVYFDKNIKKGYQQIYMDQILSDSWELCEEPKQKVPYYPVLYKFNNKIKISDEDECYQNDLHFYRERKNEQFQFIRLITEIPELIDWRNE